MRTSSYILRLAFFIMVISLFLILIFSQLEADSWVVTYAYKKNFNGEWTIQQTDVNRELTVNLLNISGNDWSIRISPDQRFVVWLSRFDNIFVSNIFTSNTIRLGYELDISLRDSPRWSPDSRHLAYRTTEGFVITTLDDDGNVISHEQINRNFSYPRWSPDGHYLVVHESGFGYVNAILIETENLLNETLVSSPSSPANGISYWSPNSDSFVYHSVVTEQPGIYQVNINADMLERSRAELIIPNYEIISPIYWSPDSRFLLFSTNLDTYNLFLWDTIDQTIRQLTFNNIWYSPYWSPLSNKIAFVDGQDLYIFDIEEATLTNPIITIQDYISHLYWSETGDQLLLQTFSNMLIMDIDGTNIRQITEDGEYRQLDQ